MAKLIPKIGSRRNGRMSSRKSACKIPKGVIHVQASLTTYIATWCKIISYKEINFASFCY